MENSVRDLWSLMNFVVPGYLGSRNDFRERYEKPLARGPSAGVATPSCAPHAAVSPPSPQIRCREASCRKKSNRSLLCDLGPTQRATYDALLREIQQDRRWRSE